MNGSDSQISLTEINARARAGEWLAVLQRPERTPEVEAAFRVWLHAHPANRKAFDDATRIWERLGAAGEALRARQRRRQTVRRVAFTAAACLVVAVGVGAGVFSQSGKRRKLSAA